MIETWYNSDKKSKKEKEDTIDSIKDIVKSTKENLTLESNDIDNITFSKSEITIKENIAQLLKNAKLLKTICYIICGLTFTIGLILTFGSMTRVEDVYGAHTEVNGTMFWLGVITTIIGSFFWVLVGKILETNIKSKAYNLLCNYETAKNSRK